MRHEWTTVVVDGFRSGETDFVTRLAEADQSLREEVDDRIMSVLVNATDGAVLLIEGHSDRVDSGEDHATALKLESDASFARARSARAGILMMLGRDWLTGLTSWSELPRIAGRVLGHGAVARVDESGTEPGRLKNRRVTLRVCRFIPD